MGDRLFDLLVAWQGDKPWGRVLDAGTGEHSLSWLLGLKTERWTAVTGDAKRQTRLSQKFAQRIRPNDSVVVGNWRDPGMLAGERFDVVIADYLVGAIDGFAPYFQSQVLGRLRPLVGQRLYLIGLEPYPTRAKAIGGELILEIARLRDACILLAGHRCYREYPLEWIVRQLELANFTVKDTAQMPILYGPRFVKGQLDVCRRKLAYFQRAELAQEMERHIDDLQSRALDHITRSGHINFGEDYVVMAVPNTPS